MAQAQQITILDASTGVQITGKLVKEYPLGLTIDDDRDVRHYAMMSRVLTQLTRATPQSAKAGNQGDIW